jgi:hypothetical protein
MISDTAEASQDDAKSFSSSIVSYEFVSYLHGSRDRRHATAQQGASGFAAHCLEQGAAKRWVGGGKHGDTSYFLVKICSDSLTEYVEGSGRAF